MGVVLLVYLRYDGSNLNLSISKSVNSVFILGIS